MDRKELSQDTTGFSDWSQRQTPTYDYRGTPPTRMYHGQSRAALDQTWNGPVAAFEDSGPSAATTASHPAPAISREPPPPYTPHADALPIVIPQIATSWQGAFMCPFARAYPTHILGHGITETDFLRFIDGFNEAFVASPAFQAANVAGMVMGQVHGVFPVQIAGAALSVVSGFGSAGVSLTRAKKYMQAANQNLFHPAGLQGQVLTTQKLLPEINYPSEKIELLPVDHEQQSTDREAPTAIVPGYRAISRRQQALEGYVQPLSFDVPASAESENLLKRMGQWQANRLADKQKKKFEKEHHEGQKKRQEKEADALKEQRKMDQELAKVDSKLEKHRQEADRKVAKAIAKRKLDEADKVTREYEKELRKLENERTKILQEGVRETQKLRGEGDHERTKVDQKEEKMANKIRWIVITRWTPETAGAEVEDEDGVPTT